MVEFYNVLNTTNKIEQKHFFKQFVVHFYQLYAIHNKITFAQSLLQVLKILKLSDNKIIEDIKYPIEPEEAFKQH